MCSGRPGAWVRARATRQKTTQEYRSGYPAVAPSVDRMTYQRLPYADQDPAPTMTSDCAACGDRLTLPRQVVGAALRRPAPSLAYDAFPREVRKPDLTVSAAAAHLASRLHLHLD